MKLLALFQILLLLGTALLPEGRIDISGGGCGCSAESRASGRCCCSEAANSCCAGSVAESRSKDSSLVPLRSCCQRKTTSACWKPLADSLTERRTQPESETMSRSCPCGATSAELAIVRMPRLRPLGVTVGGAELPESLVSSGVMGFGRHRETPPVPPPLHG